MAPSRTSATVTPSERRAGVYVRISDDRGGEAAGVGRQEADCLALIERQGWTVGQLYVENDVSAFKRRRVTLPDGSNAMRVVRPAFRQLLDDLAAGVVDALVAYDLDRVARDPRDLEDLIDVVETRRIPTRAVTGSLDLSSDAGITMSRVMLAVANKSSRDTARRVARKHLELAEQGRVGGGGIRSYGYDRAGMTVVESEAEVIREMAARVIAGDSLNTIAQDLTDRGIPTVRGGRWQARSVHSIVTKARNAGLREHRGEVVGKAAWPAIVDEDTWARVNLALEGRAEGGTNTLKRWLSGVLLCSHCGHGLVGGTTVNAGARYWCKPVPHGRGDEFGGCGKTGIVAGPTEKAVEAMILGYLEREDVARDLLTARTGSALEALRAELADDERQLRELAELWASRQVTTTEYLAARTAIDERVQRGQEALKAALPGTLRGLLVGGDLRAAWKDLAPARRREVARVVFPGGITVEPRPRSSRFDPTRLVPVGWET